MLYKHRTENASFFGSWLAEYFTLVSSPRLNLNPTKIHVTYINGKSNSFMYFFGQHIVKLRFHNCIIYSFMERFVNFNNWCQTHFIRFDVNLPV